MGRHHEILIIYVVVGMISAIILNRFVQKGWLIFGYYLIIGLILDGIEAQWPDNTFVKILIWIMLGLPYALLIKL
ncbi:MAG: hypothetical protein ACYSR9_02785 [Planctomycetota bacterium]|jgi:hypothetical protein